MDNNGTPIEPRPVTPPLSAATVGREEQVENQASAPEGSRSIDGSAAERRRDLDRVVARLGEQVRAAEVAPIGGAEMTKTEASFESRAATTSPSAAAPTDQGHTVGASEATPAENSEVQLFQAVEVPLERLVEAD
jgi:hypothetical protein